MVVPPHVSATMHTLREQHVPTAQTLPRAQSALVVQSARPEQGVWPSAQKPAPPVTEAHTHEPPGPQAVKVSHVWPVQEFNEQAPLLHTPESHTTPHAPQFAGSLVRSRHAAPQAVKPAAHPVGSGAAEDVDDVDEVEDVDDVSTVDVDSVEEVDSAEDVDDVDSAEEVDDVDSAEEVDDIDSVDDEDDADDDELLDDPEVATEVTVMVVVLSVSVTTWLVMP